MLAPDSPGALFAGHAVSVEVGTITSTVTNFAVPVTMSISYSDIDISHISDEEELWIRSLDGANYEDASDSCQPPSQYHRDIANNSITLAICRTGEFALVGSRRTVFLPIILIGESEEP